MRAKLQKPVAAVGLLGVAMAISATWLLLAGRDLTFYGDEIFYYGKLVTREGVTSQLHGIEYFFAPHNGHLVLLGRLVYEALFAVAGTDRAVFMAVEALGVIACVGIFFALAVRRTSPLIALALSILLLFFGYANETLLWPFDLHTVYAAALGLGALLALEREDRAGDVAGCALLVLSVLMVEIGLAFAVGVAVLVLLRPDRRRRLWIFLAPVALYAAWWLWARQFDQSDVLFTNIRLIPQVLTNALGAVMGCLLGINPTGAGVPVELVTVTAGGMVAAGFAIAGLIYRVRLGNVPPTLWAFFATLIVYWLTMAAAARPPDSTRYVFVSAVLVLLVAIDAVRHVRFGPRAAAALFVLVALVIPPNIAKYYDGRGISLEVSRITGSEYAMLDLVGAERVDPAFIPARDPAVEAAGGGLFVPIGAGDYFDAVDRNGSLGMSLAELRAGDPKHGAIADATLAAALRLELDGGRPPAAGSCPAVTTGTPSNLAYFDLERGGAVLGNRGEDTITVGLSRFGPGAPGAPVGKLEPGEWAEVRIPPDAALDPWRAVVDGPVAVCPLP
ncbi:MAG TPA: hypothetical protein VFM51_06435 [Solirubrobacterales bacterium]|nr:hypothetical protein [Solirubrobacterales bacterium]